MRSLTPFLVLTALVASPAIVAQPVQNAPVTATASLAGRWALRADDTTIMVFEVTRNGTGWTATWERPKHLASDGSSFSKVSGPVVRQSAARVSEVPGGLELTFGEPGPDAEPDVMTLRPRDAQTARVTYPGFGVDPAILSREAANAPFGRWVSSQMYTWEADRPTDAEMTAIFDADQADRAAFEHGDASSARDADWTKVEARDRARRVRTQALLDADRLRSSDDFYHAAFIFQHGDSPDDFLKAHALATVAAARGQTAATWIAAATLDRYLQAIGQPQVYGTQFSNPGGVWTQQPYRSDLLSDALRRASRVPTIAEQQAQRSLYEQQLGAAKP